MPIYTRANLKSRVNAGIKGKQGILVDVDETLNQAVREVLMDHDLRSTKRRVDILPGIFDDIQQYMLPDDLKGDKIVNVYDQDNQDNLARDQYGRYVNPDRVQIELIGTRQWRQQQKLGTIALDENSGIRTLLAQLPSDGSTVVVSTLDSLAAGGGAWGAFGDGANVAVDTGNYVRGSGSIKFDINAGGGTTAGIVNSTMTEFDISSFLATNGAAFVYAYITDPTDITNFEIRFGNDASNYYSAQATETHAGNVFAVGWNLLRFSLDGPTEVGSVTDTTIDYVAVFMNKDAGKISEANYRFDQIALKLGDVHKLVYYSKYGWQNAAGTWMENATDDANLLNADTDEFELFVQKARFLAAGEADETKAEDKAQERYTALSEMYKKESPSDALYVTQEYQDFI
jgi:hypothetical protein